MYWKSLKSPTRMEGHAKVVTKRSNFRPQTRLSTFQNGRSSCSSNLACFLSRCAPSTLANLLSRCRPCTTVPCPRHSFVCTRFFCNCTRAGWYVHPHLRCLRDFRAPLSRFQVSSSSGGLPVLLFDLGPANLLKALQSEITFEKEAAAEQPAVPEFLEEFNKQGIWKVRLERIFRRAMVLTKSSRSKKHQVMTRLS